MSPCSARVSFHLDTRYCLVSNIMRNTPVHTHLAFMHWHILALQRGLLRDFFAGVRSSASFIQRQPTIQGCHEGENNPRIFDRSLENSAFIRELPKILQNRQVFRLRTYTCGRMTITRRYTLLICLGRTINRLQMAMTPDYTWHSLRITTQPCTSENEVHTESVMKIVIRYTRVL